MNHAATCALLVMFLLRPAIGALNYSYYEDSWQNLPDFTTLTPAGTGVCDNFVIPSSARPDNFACKFSGFITIGTSGTYTFSTSSDDGSRLYINGNLIVDNDGVHAPQAISAPVALTQGTHQIEVTYFEASQGQSLDVQYQGPGVILQTIPASVLVTSSGPSVPSFAMHPASTQEVVGATATFSASATGNPTPTNQWYRNGVLVPGATASFYTTQALTSADNQSTYYCIATNSQGQTQSNTATLTIVASHDTLAAGITNYAEILDDWKDQDSVATKGYRAATRSIITGLPAEIKATLQARLDALAGAADTSAGISNLYVRACSERRGVRMGLYIDRFRRVVFAQHAARGVVFDNVANGPGGNLMLLSMNGLFGSARVLVGTGEARDPEVSFDGTKVLFSWRGGASGGTEYKLHEMRLADQSIRRVTAGSGNDIEAIYLPNGNIMFGSTRMVQGVDCFPGVVVNEFLCDGNGRYVRRIGYDQSPTNYPQMLPSGEVVFARWDYNDKTHTYAHALFMMQPDGTKQREYCNNNSWWPTMILQQRPIPSTTKLMAMIGGYHIPQAGKIGIIDVNVGMQNGRGVTLLAPVRLPQNDDLDDWGSAPWNYQYQFDHAAFPRAGAWPLDGWGQRPPLSAYPFPFDENAFLVSHRPRFCEGTWGDRFGQYFMTADGSRELLYYDARGCMSAVAVLAREVPPVLSSTVDYRQTTGIFQVMDIYQTQPPLLDSVPRGTIKRLRVLALDYRTGPVIGSWLEFKGPARINDGGATAVTPIAKSNASWDAKIILGETPVYDDGSAAFIVPARTPVFFQALDAKGQVVQTMRSWATLQPGETFACMGCHESRMVAVPPPTQIPIAVRTGAKPLEPFYGPARGFSFVKEIQPILDAKCVSCHSASTPNGIDLSATLVYDNVRGWSRSYLNLVATVTDNTSKYLSWLNAEDSPLLLPPYRAGSCKSPLLPMLQSGHHGVQLTQEEFDKIRCWIDLGIPHCGEYTEGMQAGDKAATDAMYVKRRAWEAEERVDIQAFIDAGQPGNSVSRSQLSGINLKSCDALRANVWAKSGVLRIKVAGLGAVGTPVRAVVYRLSGQAVLSATSEATERSDLLLKMDIRHLPAGMHVVSVQAAGRMLTLPLMVTAPGRTAVTH